jgi:hypothetical protein
LGLALPFRSVGEAIGAGLDDLRHVFTKPIVDILEPRLAALIFDAVVQQSSDSEIFVPTYSRKVAATASK